MTRSSLRRLIARAKACGYRRPPVKCIEPGCQRSTRTTSSGLVMAACDSHTRRALRDAFGPEPAPSALTRSGGAGQRGAADNADPATRTPLPGAVT